MRRPLRIPPVQTVRSFVKPWAWLAIVAMLGAALLPTLAHAVMAVKGDTQWVEVCSASGSRWVLVTDADLASGQDQSLSMDMAHCPLCCHQNHMPTVPTPQATPVVFALGTHVVPRLWLLAPTPLFAWASRLSRGPPLVG